MFVKLFYNIILPSVEAKRQSEACLIKRGAKVCEWLPCIAHSFPRNAKEIAQRTLIVLAFFNIYLGAPFEVIKRWLDEHQLLPYLSEHEKWILTHSNLEELEEKEMISLSWYVESLWALMWAGSHIENLDPEIPVEDTLVDLLPNLQKNEKGRDLTKKTKRRPYAEMYKMLDLYYRAHWFSRDGYWSKYDTGQFDLGIIRSRRQALDWIMDKNSDWDNVNLST